MNVLLWCAFLAYLFFAVVLLMLLVVQDDELSCAIRAFAAMAFLAGTTFAAIGAMV